MDPKTAVLTKADSSHKRSRYSVPNLERALQILELLLNFPDGLAQSEMAVRLHCSKTSIFRITATLLEWGYLERKEDPRSLASAQLLRCARRCRKIIVRTSNRRYEGLADRSGETC